MINFVLIHGAWHTGEHLLPVVRELQRRGHAAVAPSLPGRGSTAGQPTSHADLVQGALRVVRENNLSNLVLVGHSFGGSVIARLAEEIPDRIRRLVFWNGFVPKQGESVSDCLPPHYRNMFAELAKGTGTIMLPFEVWREVFINDADEALAKSSYASLCPEPAQPTDDRLDLTRFYQSTIPRSYLNATEDISLPPGEWGWHPRLSSRLGMYRLVQMPGSHEVLFTNPVGLAQKLILAGRD
jgi:pimeloyl-ACP methyl ester carboxylesterase